MFVINRFGKCFELINDVKASTDILISSGCEVFKDRNELYEKKKKTYIGINRYIIENGRTQGFFWCSNGRRNTVVDPNVDTLEEFIAFYM